jgi:hypothetical protein
MQQPTSAPSAPDLSETHARLTLGTAFGPLVAFLDDLLVVEIMLNADGASWVERRGILLASKLHTAAEPLVRAIAQSNSRSNHFSVVDPSMGYRQAEVPPDPRTLGAALVRLDELTSKGDKPLLGLMQVPPAWMTAFGRQPPERSTCVNVWVGTAMLSALNKARPSACRSSSYSSPWTSAGSGRRRRGDACGRSDHLPRAERAHLGPGMNFYASGRGSRSWRASAAATSCPGRVAP